MRWDHVGKAIADAAAADLTLIGIYAGSIRMNAGAQDFLVPGLEWSMISDGASELWEPCIVQWDQWTLTLPDLQASERALRKLFDHDLPITLGGVFMFSEFTDGADLTSPDRAGHYGRAVRFRYTPIRDDLRWGRS